MHLIHPSATIITPQDILHGMPAVIEAAARTCYKSEDKADPDRTGAFVKRLVCDLKHESVIEHCSISVRFIVDRSVSHELVRHRLASFSQESTRYCNYGKKGVTFIIPPWVHVPEGEYRADLGTTHQITREDFLWFDSVWDSAEAYLTLLDAGWTPQQARSVLPNSLKTEVVMTANLREWRHVLTLRTGKAAHPQMREVMVPLLTELQTHLPCIFGDIIPYKEEQK